MSFKSFWGLVCDCFLEKSFSEEIPIISVLISSSLPYFTHKIFIHSSTQQIFKECSVYFLLGLQGQLCSSLCQWNRMVGARELGQGLRESLEGKEAGESKFILIIVVG